MHSLSFSRVLRKAVVIDLLIILEIFSKSVDYRRLYIWVQDERDGKKVELHEMVISAMKIRLLIWTKACVYLKKKVYVLTNLVFFEKRVQT